MLPAKRFPRFTRSAWVGDLWLVRVFSPKHGEVIKKIIPFLCVAKHDYTPWSLGGSLANEPDDIGIIAG